MTLATNTKLGPYEILGLLGAGGMGEVYRAKDTRLDRIVAIKVLPSHLSSNPDVRQRFEREARAVSSLNHPHICTLHDIGREGETDFIVMEFIEGETLGSRLQKGSLGQSEMLRYAIQIADGLDKAHRQGIVHRDLKPGNIILTKTGAKLLDFGLAKLRSETKNTPDVSSFPTEQRDLTQEGMVLGTFQYMSPEQLEGKDADARSDIFALGAVLYEMATGKKAFEGKSQASLIAAILKEDPKPISQIQPLTPPTLDRLIQNCLAKDPDDRWQSAHDIGKELRWISEGSGSQITTVSPAQIPPFAIRSSKLGWIVAAAVSLAALGSSIVLYPRLQQKTQFGIETQFSIIPTPGTSLFSRNQADPDFAISPDGTKVVYMVSESIEKDQLWLRKVATVNIQPITGTEGARLPFWSPDGKHIAFSVGTRMFKVPLEGGTPQVICDLPGEFQGGEWLSDGTIVFGTSNSGLSSVSASGGQPKTISQVEPSSSGVGHHFPVFLPDQKHFLFLNFNGDPGKRSIMMGSLDSKEIYTIVKSPFWGRYLEPGYLLFVQGASLVVQKLEMNPPRLTGDPVRIADPELPMNLLRGVAPYTSSANGVIAYRVSGVFQRTQLAWMDRSGKILSTVGPVGSDVSVTLSPDDTRAAISSISEIGRSVGRAEIPVNIWVVDLSRGVRTRITFEQSVSDENPVWSPDGRSLAFAAHREGGQAQIFRKASSGEGKAQPVLVGNFNEHPIDWSTNGKFLLLHSAGNPTALDLMYLPLSGNPQPQSFLVTLFQEAQAQFSPDGRWVAYTSGESGREEVYIKPFPSGEGKWQVSSGGSEPRWRGDGTELFYLSPDGTMMSVKINTDPNLDISPAVPLFKTNLAYQDLDFYGGAQRYDVTRDGSRFLVNTIVVPATPPNLNVLVNWNPHK